MAIHKVSHHQHLSSVKKKKARLSGIDSRLIGKSFLLLLNVLFILSVVVIFN